MIKYFCDICEKELKTSDEHFAYILPQRAPYNVKSTRGEIVYTYEQIEDTGCAICPSCRHKIAYALEKIKNEVSKEES